MKNQENRFAKSSSEAINKPLPAAAMSEDIMFLVDRLSSNFTVALEASLFAANTIFLGRAVRRAATLFLTDLLCSARTVPALPVTFYIRAISRSCQWAIYDPLNTK